MSTVPSDVFVARRVGSSVFCTVEGRLVCLHIKTDHTFLITVTQEPLVVHLGTFRFNSLAGGRGEGASVAAYGRALIEAFERTSHVGDATALPTSAGGGNSHKRNTTGGDVGVSLLLNGAHQGGAIGFSPDASVLGSPRSAVAAAGEEENNLGLSSAADVTRRSSLVALHRDKMDLEMKQLGSPYHGDGSSPTTMRSPLKWNQRSDSAASPAGNIQLLRSEEELRNDATNQQSIGIVVNFSVFGTPHSVVMHLKSCPPEPDIREHVIWGIMMDLYRSVAQHRSHALRLEDNAQRHQSERAGFAKRHMDLQQQQQRPQHHHQKKAKEFGRTGSATTQQRRDQRPASGSVQRSSGQPFRALFASEPQQQQQSVPGANDALLQGVATSLRPSVVLSLNGTGGGSNDGESPTAAAPFSTPNYPGTTKQAKHNATGSQKQQQPPQQALASSTWSYSGRCAYLESSRAAPGCVAEAHQPSPRLRPTSASSDFHLRQEYVRDVQARGAPATTMTTKSFDHASMFDATNDPHQQQRLLLHPTAPPSAALIRGTYSGRAVLKNVSTVEITLT